MATAKRTRIGTARCECPDCGHVHWRKKGGPTYYPDPARDRQIFRLYKEGKGLTQVELGKQFNLSRPRISTILKSQRAKAVAENIRVPHIGRPT